MVRYYRPIGWIIVIIICLLFWFGVYKLLSQSRWDNKLYLESWAKDSVYITVSTTSCTTTINIQVINMLKQNASGINAIYFWYSSGEFNPAMQLNNTYHSIINGAPLNFTNNSLVTAKLYKATTNSSGLLTIRLNGANNTTKYFNCSINGYVYYTTFNISGC